MNGWCLRTELNSCVCVSNWPMHNSSTTTAAINKTDWHWNLTRSIASSCRSSWLQFMYGRQQNSLRFICRGQRELTRHLEVQPKGPPLHWDGVTSLLDSCPLHSFTYSFIKRHGPAPEKKKKTVRRLCQNNSRVKHALFGQGWSSQVISHSHASKLSKCCDVDDHLDSIHLGYVNSRRKWKVHTHIHNSNETVSVSKTHWADWHPYTKRCFDAQAVQSRCFTICAVKTLGCAGARLNPTMRWRLGSAGC